MQFAADHRHAVQRFELLNQPLIRALVLLDRELILGPGPSAHIRADELPEPAVLHLKDGRLYCQTKNEISIEDQPADRNSPIPIGRHVRVGAVTFVVTRG